MLVLSNFSFCHNVFKSRLLQIRQHERVKRNALFNVQRCSNNKLILNAYHFIFQHRLLQIWLICLHEAFTTMSTILQLYYGLPLVQLTLAFGMFILTPLYPLLYFPRNPERQGGNPLLPCFKVSGMTRPGIKH